MDWTLMIFFASKVRSRFEVTSTLSADGLERHYVLRGEVFYALDPSRGTFNPQELPHT